jgi:nucleoside-diphosphate-sugar epimerase
MRILVTGGAGFIGSHLLKRLDSENYDVVVLDDLSTGKLRNIPSRMEFIEGSVTNYNTCVITTQGVDIVIHLAALISIDESMKYPDKYQDVNCRGTQYVLQASKYNSVKRFIFVSSAACYDQKSVYARTKLIGEQYCRESNINSICLRLFNVYGEGQRKEYAGVIHQFMECKEKGVPPIIYGDGTQTRDFIYIDDVVDGIMQSLYGFNCGEFYDIGTGIGTSINKLTELICRDTNPIYEAKRGSEIEQSRAMFIKPGFIAKTSLTVGLRYLVLDKSQHKH